MGRSFLKATIRRVRWPCRGAPRVFGARVQFLGGRLAAPPQPLLPAVRSLEVSQGGDGPFSDLSWVCAQPFQVPGLFPGFSKPCSDISPLQLTFEVFSQVPRPPPRAAAKRDSLC